MRRTPWRWIEFRFIEGKEEIEQPERRAGDAIPDAEKVPISRLASKWDAKLTSAFEVKALEEDVVHESRPHRKWSDTNDDNSDHAKTLGGPSLVYWFSDNWKKLGRQLMSGCLDWQEEPEDRRLPTIARGSTLVGFTHAETEKGPDRR